MLRFERSNGLDTALNKNIPLPFFLPTNHDFIIIEEVMVIVGNDGRTTYHKLRFHLGITRRLLAANIFIT